MHHRLSTTFAAFIAVCAAAHAPACNGEAPEPEGEQALGGASGAIGGAGGKSSDEDGPLETGPQHVVTWVPPYSITPAKRVFQQTYGDVEVASVLTRIGLQFWTITAESGVTHLPGASDEDASWFVERAHEQEIEVLLTVTNDGEQIGEAAGFHWNVVREALREDGHLGVAEALVDVVESLDLDGVDLDFEAGGSGVGAYTDEDRHLFAALVETLGEELHDRDKVLTVDSFAANTGLVPQPSWWTDWVDHVDAIHAMGYDTTYKGGPGHASYQAIQDLGLEAGFDASQVIMGIPTWVDAWSGDSSNEGVPHEENLKYIIHCLDQGTGVALWSLDQSETRMLPEGGRPWITEEPWAALAEIKAGVIQDAGECVGAEPEEGLIDDFLFTGLNRLGGQWLAVNDYWDRPEDERETSPLVWNGDSSYDLALGEGLWGDIGRGYQDVNGGRGLAAVVETIELSDGSAWGGLWMEVLPRDCSQLDDINDGCGWRPEALVDLDVSEFENLVLGLRCDEGESLVVNIQSRQSALVEENSVSEEIVCSGEFENYEIPFGDIELFSRLQINHFTEETPTSVAYEIAGVAMDLRVIE